MPPAVANSRRARVGSTGPAEDTHTDTCDSLELFAKEVVPEFHDRDHEHQTWKKAVLAGDVTLDEVDVAPEAMPRPQRGRPLETHA